jgi:ABC-type antimicrobial peptide transport system permease subunit
VTVVARLSRPPSDVVPGLRQALAAVDPSMSIFDLRMADEGIRAEFGDEILASRLAFVFAVLATIVAALGLYGVLARSLAERRYELAIRTALGASPEELVRVIAREVASVLFAGLGIGVLASVWLGGFLEHRLFAVTHLDAVSFLASVAIVIVATALASTPACVRARRIAPATALNGPS